MKPCIMLFLFFGFAVLSCKKPRRLELSPGDRIFDSAYLLSKAQKDSIFILIEKVDKEIGPQIAIITVTDLNGKDINEYSLSQSEKLRLGRKKQNDGLLITVALKDRMMRIEVGYGLERIIRDEIAARIVRNIMAPQFRQEKYGQGIYDAVDTISLLIEKNRNLIGVMP